MPPPLHPPSLSHVPKALSPPPPLSILLFPETFVPPGAHLSFPHIFPFHSFLNTFIPLLHLPTPIYQVYTVFLPLPLTSSLYVPSSPLLNLYFSLLSHYEIFFSFHIISIASFQVDFSGPYLPSFLPKLLHPRMSPFSSTCLLLLSLFFLPHFFTSDYLSV